MVTNCRPRVVITRNIAARQAPSMAGSFVSNFGNGSITEGTGGAQNPETRALTQQLKEAKREAATLQARPGSPPVS